MSELSTAHFAAANKILGYLKGTKNYGLLYRAKKDAGLIGYADTDWGGYIDERRSASGYVFQLGSKAISRSSKKQATTTLSMVKAECIVVTSTTCEAI